MNFVKDFVKHRFVTPLLFGGLILSSWSIPLGAQSLGFGSSFQLSDNVANAGSPGLALFNGQIVMYYVNHTNGYICADFGLSGCQQTNIQVPYNSSAYGPTDVSAAVLPNGRVLISYNSSGSSTAAITFATSSNGVSFSNVVTPSTLSLGVPSSAGSPTPYPSALVTVGGTTYVATAGGPGVYISVTTNGQSFAPFNNSTSPIFPLAPDSSGQPPFLNSRPSFTVFNGQPWLGYAENHLVSGVVYGQTVATVGNIITKSHSYTQGGSFLIGNSNIHGYRAGLSLVAYNGYLYFFYQSSQSSQELNYRVSTNGGASFPNNYLAGVQERWTPAAIVSSSGIVYVAYQDDGNTNISYIAN